MKRTRLDEINAMVLNSWTSATGIYLRLSIFYFKRQSEAFIELEPKRFSASLEVLVLFFPKLFSPYLYFVAVDRHSHENRSSISTFYRVNLRCVAV